MKRSAAIALAAASLLFPSLTACTKPAADAASGTATSASAAPISGLVKDGQMSFCTYPEYAPMEYYDGAPSGDPIGFDSDAAKALAGHFGLKPQFVITTFDGLMPGVESGRCDVMWTALYINAERLQVADAVPYLKTGAGLIVPANSTIATSDDLAGKTVAVQAGGANEKTLTELSAAFTSQGKAAITIQSYPKTAETVAAVTNGKADALIETDVAVVDMVGKSNGALKAVDNIFPTALQFGVFTKKGSPLTPVVKEGVQALGKDGTLASLARQYKLNPDHVYTGE